MKPSYSRQLIAMLLVLGIGSFSASGFSDVYNFYFKQNKKKQKKVEAPVEEEEESSEENGTSNETEPAAPKADSGGTLKTTAGTQPLIINNYNNNTNTNTNTAEPKVETPPAVASTPILEEPVMGSSLSISNRRRAFPRFTVGAHGLLMSDDGHIGGKLGWGGVFSFGLEPTKALAFTFYGGTRVMNTDKVKFHAGTDLEVYPFRIPVADDWDFFKVGPLVGFSTAAAQRGNIGSFHIGARGSINVTRDLTLTAASRINLGMLAFEVGMGTRL